MKWPWSKKEEAKPNPEFPDDWEPRKGDWEGRHVCHCGWVLADPWPTVCPKCGCADRWTFVVSRLEWEWSPSRQASVTFLAAFAPGRRDAYQPWSRNPRVVVWAPEHCEVNP